MKKGRSEEKERGNGFKGEREGKKGFERRERMAHQGKWVFISSTCWFTRKKIMTV
jgi:hypothetical protein